MIPLMNTMMFVFCIFCSIYENKTKDAEGRTRRIIVPDTLRAHDIAKAAGDAQKTESVDIRKRKSLNSFWDKFKDSIIDLFKEEGDTEIK